MKLPTIDQMEDGKIVVLRLDLDVPISDGKIWDSSRLVKSVPTIRRLLAKKCKIIVIGHCGRPKLVTSMDGETVVDPESKISLSLRPIYLEMMSLLENDEDSVDSVFIEEAINKQAIHEALAENQLIFLENLRFYKQETDGDVNYFSFLAEVGNVFVNDALAVCHRKNASILLFKYMPTYFSLGLATEVEKMGKYFLEPKRPIILVLGGAKEDKLDNLEKLSNKVDKILIGGKLPCFFDKYKHIPNLIWANLDATGFDISQESVEVFRQEIGKSATVILAGTIGKYEDVEHRGASLAIGEAIVNSQTIKIGAGGDTKACLSTLGLDDKFDYICSGGGVALEFLANEGNLPAWEGLTI